MTAPLSAEKGTSADRRAVSEIAPVQGAARSRLDGEASNASERASANAPSLRTPSEQVSPTLGLRAFLGWKTWTLGVALYFGLRYYAQAFMAVP
jgi:hypothetical protein